MFWRVVHDFLKWLWPAVFGGFVVTAGIAVAASQVWPEAKAWTATTFQSVSAVMSQSWFIPLALGVFVVWFAAFLWSGHCVNRASVTPPNWPSVPTPLSASTTASIGIKVTRAPAFDVSLTEAALYAVTGRWGMIGGKEHFGTKEERAAVGNQVAAWLSDFEQRASNGDVRIWGRPQENSSGPIVEIDALHWRTHEAFPISVVLGEPQSRQRLSLSREGGYDDLRVNRAEFEEQWPHD